MKFKFNVPLSVNILLLIVVGLFIPILNLISRLPWKVLYALSDFLQLVVFKWIGYRKKVIFDNLHRSFPEKSEAEIQQIANDFYQYFGDLVVEVIKMKTASKEEVYERLHIPEKTLALIDNLKTGAVVVMGHRGNWELANLYSSAFLKPETITVYRPLASVPFENWFSELRTRFGSTMAPMRKIYVELEKERTHPYLVVLVNDQSPNPTTAYWTTFLNQDTGVFRGAENIARDKNIPVFFGDVERVKGKRGYYQLHFELLSEAPLEQPVNSILEVQVQALERKIKEQPGNWLWSHKRWKHKRPAQLKSEQLLGK